MKEGLEQRDRHNSFDRQFEKREMVETAGGTAEVVDIRPEHRKDDVPVLFAPGWGGTIPTYKLALEALAAGGRRAISLNHPRRGGEITLSDEEKKLVSEYPKAEIRKALTLLDVLKSKGVEKTDIIAHSEGAINAMLAALLQPERVRNIVLFSPSGLIGKDTPLRLLNGFAFQGNPKPTLDGIAPSPTVSDEEKKRTATEGAVPIEYPALPVTDEIKEIWAEAAKAAVEYVKQNPVRAIAEGWALSHIQAEGLIDALREHGIGIVVMSAVDDPVFPTERMASRLKAGSLDGFLSVRGGHGEIGEHSEQYVGAALDMLDALRDKRAETTAGTSG